MNVAFSCQRCACRQTSAYICDRRTFFFVSKVLLYLNYSYRSTRLSDNHTIRYISNEMIAIKSLCTVNTRAFIAVQIMYRLDVDCGGMWCNVHCAV